jgi:hypothetical protein
LVSPSILRILLQDGKQKAEKSQAESSAGRSVQSNLMPAGVPLGCALEAQCARLEMPGYTQQVQQYTPTLPQKNEKV